MRHGVFAALIGVMLAIAGPAVADCDLYGKSVPEGTRDGGFVCQDGQWVPG